MKKKLKWYEPYSRFRKFWWYWCFVVGILNMPFVFTNQNGKNMNLVYVILNWGVCWFTFDQTFEKKPEDDI